MRQVSSFIIVLLFSSALCAGGPSDEDLLKNFTDYKNKIRKIIGDGVLEGLRDEALQKFRSGNFDGFDPLVGDTSCELRALLALIANNEQLLDEQTYDFITLVYILTQAFSSPRGEDGFTTHQNTGENRIELLDSFLLQHRIKLSKNALKEILKRLQQAVAYGSVIFARQQARAIATDIGAHVQDLFMHQCLLEPSLRRPVVPCLGVAHLLLERARATRLPIVMRLRLSNTTTGPSLGTVTVAYVADQNGVFQALNPHALPGNQAVVVVESRTTLVEHVYGTLDAPALINLVRELDFEQLFLFDSALHPQFAGDIKWTHLINVDGNIIAKEWQAAMARNPDYPALMDPRVFVAVHIYMARLEDARLYNPFDANVLGPARPVHLPNAVYFPADEPEVEQEQENDGAQIDLGLTRSFFGAFGGGASQ